MAQSMTGYGRAEADKGKYKFTIEINTVNNRYLDYQIRLPKSLMQLENDIKNLLNQRFSRGKVMVAVGWEQEQAGTAIILDEDRAEAYHRIYNLLKKKFSLGGDLSLRDFASLPDLIKIEKDEEDLSEIWKLLEPALIKAADSTVLMRQTEANNLIKDMVSRIDLIRKVTGEIEVLAVENVKLYQARLQGRIKELLGDSPVDEQRIAIEVALLAEKSDVTEECIRLKSHLDQLEASFSETDSIGKRLNFILQELNREANTTGSKSAFYEISKRVILIKEEIERLREQVQNIE